MTAGWLNRLRRLTPSPRDSRDVTPRGGGPLPLPASHIDEAPVPMLAVDGEGLIRASNRLLDELFGYAPGELQGQPLEILLPQAMRNAHARMRDAYMQTGHLRPMAMGKNLVGRHKDGHDIPVEVGLSSDTTPTGERRFIATVIDVSEKKRWERELAEANALMSSIIQSSPFSIIATDLNGRIIAMSPASERLLQYRPEELIDHYTPTVLHAPEEITQRAHELSLELREPVISEFDVFIHKAKQGTPETREWTYIRKDGTRVPVSLTVSPLRNHAQEVNGYLGIAYDISDRKKADDYIHYLAHHDELTRLPNRTLLQDRLNMAMERARRCGRRVGLMMLDLDHFKRINDSLGHHTGDQLLVQVAQRLAACVRASDTVARMGGDEFVIVLEEIQDQQCIHDIARKIIQEISRDIVIGSHTLLVTPSIGTCIYPDDGEDAVALLKNADTAMYEAKGNGRGTVQPFTPRMAVQVTERMALEYALRIAVDKGDFILHYQPQFCLRSHRVTGVEALLRWQHPQHGMIPPSAFIAIAEESGLIVPLGEWVLKTACQHIQELREVLQQPLVLAVNLSPRQLVRKDFADQVRIILEESGLPPDALELEITEGILLQHTDDVTRQLQALRTLGIRIAIDDFGTGYCSLSYLTRFSLDRIKIDRGFVQRLGHDSSSEAVVHAIIALAHGLGMQIVAEGVETITQRDHLQLRGCDTAQGYLFAHPMPITAVLPFLQRGGDTISTAYPSVKPPSAR